MRRMRYVPLLLFCLTSPAAARGNPALLGIVAVERDGRVVVAYVLPKSPALEAGLQKGDQLLFIADREIEDAGHVDAALRSATKGETVEVEFRRDGKKM